MSQRSKAVAMRLVFLLLALLLVSTLDAASAAPRYANPVIDHDFPDPTVIRAPDGFYYVYATQSAGADGVFRNIAIARSRDLVHWTELADALPIKPTWASRTQDFWAPDVVASGGRYYLYYSARPDAALADDKQGLCLAVATADRPDGPFTDSGRPLRCGPGFENIDPMALDDPASGKRLLYWGSGFGPIKVQALAANRLSFEPGSAPMPLLAPVKSDDTNEYRRLVEGAWVVRHGGFYYLMASGDNCCGPKAHYGVFVARSRSALGPFTVRPRPAYLVVEGNERWIAPGHNTLITDARGRTWMLYHGIDAANPRAKPGDEVNTRRVMLLDPIEWKSGWPVVRGVHPSSGLQAAPATR